METTLHNWDIHIIGIRIISMLLVCMMLPALSWWMYIILWIVFGVHVVIGKKYYQYSLMIKNQVLKQHLIDEMQRIEKNLKESVKQNDKTDNKDD